MIDELDLRVDLNTEDDTGLPWAFLRDAPAPERIREVLTVESASDLVERAQPPRSGGACWSA